MRKQYILYTVVIIGILFSFVYINNNYNNNNSVSALSYGSNVGIGFTFEPTLSVSISSSDLIISNLTPGSSENSNSINISVATNASYGYTLSVNSSSDYLTRSNNVNTFSSIATNADLASLTTDNTWGYSTSLDNGNSWSNYNGLSSSSNTILLDKDNNSSSNINFKIAAKAGPTQPSGIYTNTITFTAVTKPTPMNLAESYFAAGKTRHNGYYAMQDMTTEICNNTEVIGEGSQTQLIDIRDDKVYWATKLADGHCWMTQNLDLDLDSTRTYTHWDTDLGWTTLDENIEWNPDNTTINFKGNSIPGWINSNNNPYSSNPGDIYYYTSNSQTDDIKYNSLQECVSAGHNDCSHYHVGNYYNWSATVASNNTSSLKTQFNNAPNSICPAGWRLPVATNDGNNLHEFGTLLYRQNIITSSTPIYNEQSNLTTNGFNLLRSSPVYFVRSSENGHGFIYYSSTISGSRNSYGLYCASDNIILAYDISYRYYGQSVRCLAR